MITGDTMVKNKERTLEKWWVYLADILYVLVTLKRLLKHVGIYQISIPNSLELF